MCDNCKLRYGIDESSCDRAMLIAAERYARLRSDEWLERAAEEIAADVPDDCYSAELALAILRKHRDGKA